MNRLGRLASIVGALVLATGTVSAHGAALRGSAESLSIPTWLFLATGGGVVGASFLLATFATDRSFVRWSHDHARTLAAVPRRLRTILAPLVGLLGLLAVLAFGFGAAFDVAPTDPQQNLAVLIVWVGWWAGYVMTLYLAGNTWPALDPFRTVASALPSLDRDYPAGLGAWPAVLGLLALVFVEVTLPLAEDPVVLAGAVSAYGTVTVLGAVVFGVEEWFSKADPVARAFDHYGRVAPLERTADGVVLRLPGAGLVDAASESGRPAEDGASAERANDRGPLADAGGVAFVVALVFATTYDGFVATPAWKAVAEAVHSPGVPGIVVYAVAYALGFVAFVAVYRWAARSGRRTGDTFVAVDELARRFAPPLLAIAAGYHLAHYLGFFVSLSLPLASALAAPTAPPPPQLFVLPSFFGGIAITAILVGHLLAVWVAHAIGFEVFPERLQAVRAQYGFVAVMIAYTTLSLWIVSQPTITPPFL
ncbi:hypothetical protein [Halorubellus sp. PRR65]|uniref:hypothetical protein n=1 Tax=Halorubellus sp. PRR65 TaxID=3098148 RepID=UPI002B258857|nr:hypothetical protein [Halorubellus sp. PRR65]